MKERDLFTGAVDNVRRQNLSIQPKRLIRTQKIDYSRVHEITHSS
jgi:hypothetical protein